MSRFTQPPFQFPRQPLSPPDTNRDYVPPSQFPLSAPVHHVRASAEPEESPSARFRRVSTLAYHTSSLSARERPAPSPVNRPSATKFFIVVTPPSAFIQAHGQLGHTLSSGPRHRLADGILMPLFPTIHGQLTAIAREFNFPSTQGICIYLQHSEGGTSITPRISHDTWPFIWSHVFEGPSAATQIPIRGRIEFDVDLHLARWYSSWVASFRMDIPSFAPSLAPSPVPSRAPSVVHNRMDSRGTLMEDNMNDESDNFSIRLPPTRHVPRKLSLVERFDTSSVRSRAPLLEAPQLSPEAHAALSPIFQEEEPKTAHIELESRVRSWRASASLGPTTLAANGQTSLEPANLPNSFDLADVESDPRDEPLNLADYTWSISSAGPGDDELESILSWDRVPSVHLANRLQGSVCMTPSVCTSFGPADYDELYYSPAASHLRLPSPDLAERMFEDRPITPSTVTSWGAPLSYPSSPASEYYARSLDIGERAVFSRPVTPTTATSWGPSSWPSSPVESEYRAPSVDLGERAVFSRPGTPTTATSWGPSSWPASPVQSEFGGQSVHLAYRGDYSRPVTPSTATSWGAPMSFPPSPTTPYYVHTPDAGQRFFFDDDQISAFQSTVDVSSIGSYPYFQLYQPVYPHHVNIYPSIAASMSAYVGYPTFDLYPSTSIENAPKISLWTHTWPYAKYTAKNEVLQAQAKLWNHSWPYNVQKATASPVKLWSQSWPYNAKAVAQDFSSPHVYPFFELYKPVYPHHVEIYPTAAAKMARYVGYPNFDLYTSTSEKSVSHSPMSVSKVDSPHVYPYFQLYTPVYPHHVEIYLVAAAQMARHVGYPDFNLYPATSERSVSKKAQSVKLWNHSWPYARKSVSKIAQSTHVYPYFQLYTPVYPHHVEIYPAAAAKMARYVGYPSFDLYPSTPEKSVLDSKPSASKVESPHVYPFFQLYTPVYPHHVEIYPAAAAKMARYVGYPSFDLYPSTSQKSVSDSKSSVSKIENPNVYPFFQLYTPVYPHHVEIYPAAAAKMARYVGYPSFDLYPSTSQKSVSQLPVSRAQSLHVYPFFQLYAPVYPHHAEIYPAAAARMVRYVGYPSFDLYPPTSEKSVSDSKLSVSKLQSPHVYPFFQLYIPVYPHHVEIYPEAAAKMARYVGHPDFNLYPATSERSMSKKAQPVKLWNHSWPYARKSVSKVAQSPHVYPFFQLYTPVYPHHVEIYPLAAAKMARYVGYPDFNLYPATSERSMSKKAQSVKLWNHSWPYARKPVSKVAQSPHVYPFFQLYTPVYPHHVEIYPVAAAKMARHVGYPDFNLYPATSERSVSKKAQLVKLWNHSWPYTRKSVSKVAQSPHVYPFFQLYTPVYPHHVEMYPVAAAKMARHVGYPTFDIYLALDSKEVAPAASPNGISNEVYFVYPFIQLYRPVYPYNLEELYLPVQSTVAFSHNHTVSTNVLFIYPFIRLYYPVYPHMEIYPPVAALMQANVTIANSTIAASKAVRAMPEVTKPVEVVKPVKLVKPTEVVKPVAAERPKLNDRVPPPVPRRARSGSVSAKLLHVQIAPSPTGLLPSPPAPAGGRPMSYVADPNSPSKSMRGLPGSPAETRRSSVAVGKAMRMNLSSVGEHEEVKVALTRARTTVTPSSRRTVMDPAVRLDRSSSYSSPATRPRDSLVLKRVKAFNSNAHDDMIEKPDDVMKQFPMPPPTVPKLDLHRYPFA